MREKPSQPVLFLLFLALLAPVAVAHPVKPARAVAPARPAHAAHPASKVRVSARSQKSAKAEPRHAAKEPPQTRVSAGRVSAHGVEVRTQPDRRIANHPIEERVLLHSRVEQPKSSHALAPTKEVRVEHPAEAPEPLAKTAELPPIAVHHNRKIHLTPESSVPLPGSSTPTTSPATPPPTEAAPSTDTAAPALKQSASASVVERKLPTVKPAPVLIPDPVIEPVLYTARGHLIVPPAMKGSTEILRHQNEMADRDGLIRVQDDDDLDRLRASKQLVSLPNSPALEVDERLPANRRYCRPWTAEFLAALARAHYTRFHSPLQVNSAVRTVEFQERLRFTNGNAAPAEGQTASPHLTGQAVDLAKRGLSMTEIAWLRGYLMPLVQQGKVDVEEEFQQSCFHISVYKKYMPQPAPKREIQPRSTATALAAVIR